MPLPTVLDNLLRLKRLYLFGVFLLSVCQISDSVFKKKCGVEDTLRSHPERPKRPSKDFTFAAANSLDMNCQEKHVIPLVWHVIYNSKGTGNVSDSVLDDQLRAANKAFEKTAFRFVTDSIKRVVNSKWFDDCFTWEPEFQQALAVSPATKLNMYTCRFRDPNKVGDTSMPWYYPENSVYHGIAIHFGTLPGGPMMSLNLGYNMVHQIGHYLGLFHVFEGGCVGPDDDVADTPLSDPTYGCPDHSVDTCPEEPGLDSIHNYMGYADDACMSEFSAGQITRMDWAVQKYRPSLVKTAALKPCTIDAVFRWTDGYIYFFAGSSYYRFSESAYGIEADYPQPISGFWRGVPSHIDVVFRYANGMTYFFKGDQYYRFNDTTMRVNPGYPRPLTDYWLGVPDNIDDVISNGYTYFFKGTQYYRFNHKTNEVDPSYPQPISAYWTGVSSDVDGALPWYNGGVYFFRDAQFSFFLDNHESVGVSKNYPKPIQKWWSDEVSLTGYTAFRNCKGFTYFFKGAECWRYNDQEQHVHFRWPKPLTVWAGVPTNVHAAFAWSNGYTYFFKGSQYYRYNSTAAQVDSGYPKDINTFWKGVPNDLDAVFRYTNGITYFFKGHNYYRFNDTTLQVEPGYPQSISSFWEGIPDDIDTVFTWSNGYTYFFKGNQFYRFNCRTGRVDRGYPRPLAQWRGMLYQP